jgi:hypothetical protein
MLALLSSWSDDPRRQLNVMNCTEPKGKANASGRPRQAAPEKLGAPLGHRKRLREAISNLASPGQPTPSGAAS